MTLHTRSFFTEPSGPHYQAGIARNTLSCSELNSRMEGYDSIYDGIYNPNIIFVDEIDEEYVVDDESEECDEDDCGYTNDGNSWGGGIPGQDIVTDDILTITDFVPSDRIPLHTPVDSTIAEA